VHNANRVDAYTKVFSEADRRARMSGFSTVKFWFENDIESGAPEDMPIVHYRPISYVKTAFVWAFYYLKHDYEFEKAIKDIISRGGDS
jgi:hypothetical protein